MEKRGKSLLLLIFRTLSVTHYQDMSRKMRNLSQDFFSRFYKILSSIFYFLNAKLAGSVYKN